MRDFRDAKAMAQTLRESLSAKDITISHSDCLELVSKMLGVSDWNTLSAMLQTRREEARAPAEPRSNERGIYPAIPIKDFVPFPATQFPLIVAREKTKLALDKAFTREREIVLVVQKDPTVEEPGSDDIYDIAVLARLLELERLPDGLTIGGHSLRNGAMKILLQAYRRVEIRHFVGKAGAFEVDIANISEGPIPEAPRLIQKAIELFEGYAAKHDIGLRILPSLNQIRDPGRVADVISSHMALPIHDKQNLLATVDPVMRLERVAAFMEQRLQGSRVL